MGGNSNAHARSSFLYKPKSPAPPAYKRLLRRQLSLSQGLVFGTQYSKI